MKIAPYIGITGFMRREEVEAVLPAFPENSPRKLMVGVLASAKTLGGQMNKWPRRYPPVEQLGRIFPADNRAFNLIHYNTKEIATLPQQLARLVALAGPDLHGFQLNIPWPEIALLDQFRRNFPDQKIVLQISDQAMSSAGNQPWRIAEMIKRYVRAGVADAFLLDSSGGLGIPANYAFYLDCLRQMAGYESEIGFGAAGGLSARTFGKMKPLVFSFQDVNCDAEGALRDDQDRLDPAEALAYAVEAQTKIREWLVL